MQPLDVNQIKMLLNYHWSRALSLREEEKYIFFCFLKKKHSMHFTVTYSALFNQVNHSTNNWICKLISQCKIDPIHCDRNETYVQNYCFKYTQKLHHFTLSSLLLHSFSLNERKTPIFNRFLFTKYNLIFDDTWLVQRHSHLQLRFW